MLVLVLVLVPEPQLGGKMPPLVARGLELELELGLERMREDGAMGLSKSKYMRIDYRSTMQRREGGGGNGKKVGRMSKEVLELVELVELPRTKNQTKYKKKFIGGASAWNNLASVNQQAKHQSGLVLLGSMNPKSRSNK